jgi:hypothetical protein
MTHFSRLACVALAATLLACAKASNAATSSQAPVDVVAAHLDAENAHDVERILATLADSFQLHVLQANGRDSVHHMNRSAQRRSYQRAVTAAPQSHFEMLSQIQSGPFVVNREEASGLPGGASEVGLAMYHVVNGRIAALWILNSEGMQAGQKTSR